MRAKLVPGFVLLIAMVGASHANQAWVSRDASGKLVYRTLPRGDRIVDFSYAGYMGGGVALPQVPVAQTVAPSRSDDSVAIQAAIDAVSAMPLKNGFRGAVLLGPGTFQCSRTPTIAASGVVLRGSGPTEGGTTLKLTGDPHVAISIGEKETIQMVGEPAHIAEAYVPSGAQSIMLDDATSFAAGDTIRITRDATPKWLHFMGMDKMTRDGKDEVWVGNSISTLRTVVGREGNVLKLDIPLTDSYDREFLPPWR